ncbi:receptor protein kinase TMK1-like [Aristolochia californica]|uniref:receptor protein kinase TMK1-like n=1 Tax=Aristolochia californica TaxID=171875 RepID=UPI0035DE83CD
MGGLPAKLLLFSLLIMRLHSVILGFTDASDAAILDDFRKGLKNSEALEWGDNHDPCGPPAWRYVFCENNRVTQLQVKNLGLIGPLPQNFNKLSKLTNLGMQHNSLNGKLPSFSGLSELQYAYLGNNNFDTIPSDFFNGLDKLQAMSLEYNPLNKSGWILPSVLKNSPQLVNLSLINTNVGGPLPEFLGEMPSLTALKLSYNSFTGQIPASYGTSSFQILWLNNNGLTGPIDAVGSMFSLKQLWLNSNQFTGAIPASIGNCSSLSELWLNNNQLVGIIPLELTSLPLQVLKLDSNTLMGSIPTFPKEVNVTLSSNSFCQPEPGIPCSPQVTALLSFVSHVNYPITLADSWVGDDPCANNWLGVSCKKRKVATVNLPGHGFNGTLSPSLAALDSLENINFAGNNLSGVIPDNYTQLKSLKQLNLQDNNLQPPVPKFNTAVRMVLDGNKLLNGGGTESPLTPGSSRSPSSPNSSPDAGSSGDASHRGSSRQSSKRALKLWVITASVLVLFLLLLISVWYIFRKKKKGITAVPPPVVVHPRESSDSEVKIVIADRTNQSSSITARDSQSIGSSGAQVFESGNLVISVQVLRKVTNNFASHNELGRGGFGTVYKGEFEDGTLIAVKRMESRVITYKALDEFQSEIAVLSKVRHRHLVSLLGYSIEGNERLLVYEYMPQGALSKHLFQWKKLNLEPLSWKRRLNIALDVARGMEYLHSLAQQSFIHRDLKSANILLGDNFRAKVSDFGLVKLAPDSKQSVATRLAGTFGYLAPEYAVTGKVTTKADVFSFGVVLMELVTGLRALDDDRPEENRYLVEWFWRVKSNKEKLMSATDQSLGVNEETFESIAIIAELAGHCTARDPNQRPDMGHAVSVLSPLVEKWKPMYNDQEEYMGIDCSQPLCQMVKAWQATDSAEYNLSSIDDSRGSIPPVPTGFAESFASNDAR